MPLERMAQTDNQGLQDPKGERAILEQRVPREEKDAQAAMEGQEPLEERGIQELRVPQGRSEIEVQQAPQVWKGDLFMPASAPV